MIIDKFKRIDPFTLMSGAPIHIPEVGFRIHQPRLYEIALIGEGPFYEYLSYFKIQKSIFLKTVKDEVQLLELENMTEYELLKLVIKANPEVEKGLITILKMLIKDVDIIKFNPFFIFISTTTGQQYTINDDSFLIIKDIIYQIFNIKESSSNGYNPSNSIASDIAKKLEERKKKLTQADAGKKEQSVLDDFVSILAVGLGTLNIRDILNLTIYQVFNIMKRFGMYNQYNIQVQALMQGAEELELVDWTKKI